MARRPIGRTVAVLLCAFSTAAAGATGVGRVEALAISVAMDGTCVLNEAVQEITRRESTRLWASAGIRLQWMTTLELPYAAPRSEWLVIRCTTALTSLPSSNPVPVLPVASIRFVDTEPTNTIQVNLGNAVHLLALGPRQAAELNTRLPSLRNARLGRMLGRAIAHEIGHFLTRSTSHASEGLMRPSHTVAALTGVSLHPFAVDPAALARQVAAARNSSRNRALQARGAARAAELDDQR